jgi:hypothetical protein
VIFFRRAARPEPEPRRSSYDHHTEALADLGAGAPPPSIRGFRRPLPPGIGSPVNYAVHGWRISTMLAADGAEARERRWRAIPDEPRPTAPSFDQMRFGPWHD